MLGDYGRSYGWNADSRSQGTTWRLNVRLVCNTQAQPPAVLANQIDERGVSSHSDGRLAETPLSFFALVWKQWLHPIWQGSK